MMIAASGPQNDFPCSAWKENVNFDGRLVAKGSSSKSLVCSILKNSQKLCFYGSLGWNRKLQIGHRSALVNLVTLFHMSTSTTTID
jgi:hypothetical protein